MDSKSIGLCPQGLESPRCRNRYAINIMIIRMTKEASRHNPPKCRDPAGIHIWQGGVFSVARWAEGGERAGERDRWRARRTQRERERDREREGDRQKNGERETEKRRERERQKERDRHRWQWESNRAQLKKRERNNGGQSPNHLRDGAEAELPCCRLSGFFDARAAFGEIASWRNG